MAVEVCTTEYEFSHGKAPRGFGSWAFAFNPHWRDVSEVFWVNGSTYGDARKVACQKAKAEGHRQVFVCP